MDLSVARASPRYKPNDWRPYTVFKGPRGIFDGCKAPIGFSVEVDDKVDAVTALLHKVPANHGPKVNRECNVVVIGQITAPKGRFRLSSYR